MGDDKFRGYRGDALETLKRFGVGVWSEVTVTSRKGSFEGVILPRSEIEDERHIVLKLTTGYNVGVATEQIENISERGSKEAHYKIPEKEFPFDPAKPNVQLFGTGGTIASRLDYRTGAVIPAFSPGELYGAVPELADICNLKTEKLFGVFSENMTKVQYLKLAERIGEEIEKGVAGIVIGHGTDTMHHTGAILSYMVQDSPVPIVLVGSQRSSDRPSSDAARNLIHSVYTAAYGDIAEVMVCMYGPTSDDYGLLHRGTRVRKMHSSYRSTFRTISDVPLAMVEWGKITPIKEDYKKRRTDNNVRILPYYDDRVTIQYYYPGFKPDIIDGLVEMGYKGIVIAGTGLGHVNYELNDSLERAIKRGVTVVMTVQTLWGYVQMYVYDTGRFLLDIGIIPLGNMLPEAAFMKLCWALGQTDEPTKVREIMETPTAGDITDREPPNGYLIFQGGVSEVEEFLKGLKR